jgi:hypothetical protein
MAGTLPTTRKFSLYSEKIFQNIVPEPCTFSKENQKILKHASGPYLGGLRQALLLCHIFYDNTGASLKGIHSAAFNSNYSSAFMT